VPDAGDLVPELLTYLESESVEARRAAAAGLSDIHLYPVPEVVEASKDDPDQQVREFVQNNITEAPPADILPVRYGGTEDSRLLGMSATLKFQSQPGRWDPINSDPYHSALLEGISQVYQSGGSGYIPLPYYEPEATLLVPLEIALHEASSRKKGTIAIYSPTGRGHWGSYGDFKQALKKFGLDFVDEPTSAALPTSEWLDSGHVYRGEINYNQSDNQGPAELILVRSADELAQVSNLNAVVCHLQGRCPDTVDALLEGIRDRVSRAPVFVQYSLYTEHKHGHGWSKYGYPDDVPDSLPPILSRLPSQALTGDLATLHNHDNHMTPLSRAGYQIDQLGRDRELTIRVLGNETIQDALNTIYSQYQDLEGPEVTDLVSGIRGAMYKFQKLPVPVNLYNDWIRQQSKYHGRYMPQSTAQLLQSLNQIGEGHDLAYVPATVQTVVEALETLIDELAESNPKFSRLVSHIERVSTSAEEVAFLFLSERMLEVFKFGIEQSTEWEPDQLREMGIYLCRPADLRGIIDMDTVVFVEDIPKPMASFYFLPGAERIEILSYGDQLEEYIPQWIETQTDKVHTSLRVSDGITWPSSPAVSQERQDIEEPAEPTDQAVTPSPVDFEIRTGGPADSPTETPDQSTTSDSEREIWTVEIKTRKETIHRVDSNKSVLIEREQHTSGQEDYTWIRAEHLNEGDEFTLVPKNVRQELYESRLEEFYEQDKSGENLLQSLNLWWDAMREIYDEYENIDIIYSLLDREGLSKSKGTVRDWLRSVNTAEGPIDLVEYPDLTIGPDSADDIHLVGRVFDRDKLVAQADVIQEVMREFRQENREQGQELNREIVKLIRDPPESLQSNLVTGEVKSVEHRFD
jgi:hypothetical protein